MSSGDEVTAAIDAAPDRPREAPPAPVIGTAVVTPSMTVARAIEVLAAAKAEALPVVDADGNLVGELTAGSLLQLGVRDHLLSLATPAALSGTGSIDQAIRLRAEATIESLRVISANGFPTVQEDEPSLEVAIRLAGAGRTAYVLRGRRLVGSLGPSELLRRFSAGER